MMSALSLFSSLVTESRCARAFDRFWRGSTDTAGCGLVLAIVAGLARASDATAVLRPRTRGSGLDAHVRCRAPATLAERKDKGHSYFRALRNRLKG